MKYREVLKFILDAILKQMRDSIREVDLSDNNEVKDYEVYSTKEFIVDYTKDVADVSDIRKVVKGDKWMLSKIAESAISAIGQRVELESKINTALIASTAEFIHSYAVSTRVRTKWGVAIYRNEGYWSMNIAVANVADVGEMPAMVFTWCLGKEKKGN